MAKKEAASTLELALTALAERRYLVAEYSTPLRDGAIITRKRTWLLSHIYEAKNGLCVVAFDSYRQGVRTFRLDRVQSAELGEKAPAPKVPDGMIVIYPATYQARRAKPYQVKAESAEKYLAKGWAAEPVVGVLAPSDVS